MGTVEDVGSRAWRGEERLLLSRRLWKMLQLQRGFVDLRMGSGRPDVMVHACRSNPGEVKSRAQSSRPV